MKSFKLSLLIILLALLGCNNDQSATDCVNEQKQNVLQYKTNADYSLEEILNGIRKWDSLRSNPDELLHHFENYNALNLNMALFPQGNALHAYACILNGELKFAVISEVYDTAAYHNSLRNYIKIVDVTYSDITTVTEQTYESYTFPLPTQYIQATDAINRIEDWNTNYKTWLTNTSPVYQSFHIPTYSLEAQNYTAYFGLKKNIENPSIKDADLVLDNNNRMFYDTVSASPPIYRAKNYLLELI